MTKKRKTILIISAVFAAGAAIAVPVTVHQWGKPNFANMTPRQARAYFDSNAFRDANEQTRRDIREQFGEAMQARMEKQVNDYFALPEGDQRIAYLDNLIDETQARRAEFLARMDPNRPPDANRPFGFGPPDPNRPFDPNRFARFGPRDANGRPRFGRMGANAGQRPRPNPERMRERSSRMSADSRVKMDQFRRDMQKRMQERGIQMPMMGPGGRGGFGPGPGARPPPN